VKVGLFAVNYATCGDPEAAVKVAQAAEEAGFESVWTGEHIVLPDPMGAGSPFPPETPVLDTVVALALIAAHTSTLRIASGIIILPQRNPLVLAKELAGIDVVSGGRLIVGVGAGYVEPEFDALGIPFERRGARMEDYIRALRAIWTMDRPRYEGEFASFANVNAFPRPHQRPSPPIVVGGGSWPAVRRAFRLGNGWYGFALTPEQAHEYIEAFRHTAEREERPPELGELEITVTPVGRFDLAALERYAALGVHRLVVLPRPDATREERHSPVPLEDILRNIDAVAAVVGDVASSLAEAG
jgi:probable F420-dependent oxidoreductase